VIKNMVTLEKRLGLTNKRWSFVGDSANRFTGGLPPGQQCIANDDQLALVVYLDAVVRAQNLDRQVVRASAEQEFSSDAIVDRLIAVLDRL
jgi:hypothetical protein